MSAGAAHVDTECVLWQAVHLNGSCWCTTVTGVGRSLSIVMAFHSPDVHSESVEHNTQASKSVHVRTSDCSLQVLNGVYDVQHQFKQVWTAAASKEVNQIHPSSTPAW